MVELQKVDKHFSDISIKSIQIILVKMCIIETNWKAKHRFFMANILNKRNPLNNFIYVKYVNS